MISENKTYGLLLLQDAGRESVCYFGTVTRYNPVGLAESNLATALSIIQ